jgi:hydroxyacylglutathione hydrolase
MSRGMSSGPAADRSTMVLAQFYVECLSQASYLVGDTSTGQAVIVDPRRHIQEYLETAAAHGLRIAGVINTHFHADFLTGHLELAKATGAWIGYGRLARTEFRSRALLDGQRISLGDVTLEIMETSGHTPESISVLVYEHADDDIPYGVLTGDALLIGDVGRPDLLTALGLTAEELGRHLHHSVQHKLMHLPDAVRVFPGHGAGSACGRALSSERQSTIGQQRRHNHACRPMSQEEFVALVTTGQPAAPEYFLYDAIHNRKRRELVDVHRPVPALDGDALEAALARGAVVLDARSALDFAAGHLSGSLHVPADNRFAVTTATLLTAHAETVLITPEGREDEIALCLAQVGFDNVVGRVVHPEAALLDRPERVRRASRVTATRLAQLTGGTTSPSLLVLDVRDIGEHDAGHIPGSRHLPLAELGRRIDEIPADRPVVVYCASGARSSTAASLLRHAGHPDVSDLIGGYAAWLAVHEPPAA